MAYCGCPQCEMTPDKQAHYEELTQKHEETKSCVVVYQMCPRCGKTQPKDYKFCLGCGLRAY